MSKVSFSRELLGTIKFVFDKTKSRTLNATQAYDTSTSQIVLASYPATSTIKGSAKSLGKVVRDDSREYGTVAVHATQTGLGQNFGLKAREVKVDTPKETKVIGLAWTPELTAPAAKNTTLIPADTAQFSGAWWLGARDLALDDPGSAKSNATKEFYYGAITVGTGLYRDWQNKYAVLKVDLLTNKAILRVYNE